MASKYHRNAGQHLAFICCSILWVLDAAVRKFNECPASQWEKSTFYLRSYVITLVMPQDAGQADDPQTSNPPLAGVFICGAETARQR